MAIKLLPCPNPACPAKGDVRAIDYNSWDGQVQCGSCGLAGPSEEYKDGAVALWNDLPRSAPLREKCRVALEQRFLGPQRGAQFGDYPTMAEWVDGVLDEVFGKEASDGR